MGLDGLVTIRTYDDPLKAHIAAARLEEGGIPVFLDGIHRASLTGKFGSPHGGANLQVPANQADLARQILRFEE